MAVLRDINSHHGECLASCAKDHAGKNANNFALAYRLIQLVAEYTWVPDVEDHILSLLEFLLNTRPYYFQVSINAPLGSSDHGLVHSEAQLV